MRLSISRVHFPVTALGPGKRLGVWFQGCSIRCPGCISVDTWDPDAGDMSLENLLDHVAAIAPEADGITVSGGEPFDQPEALAALLSAWRSASATSTFVFTGREFAEIEAWLHSHPGLVDAVMTGPFRADLPQKLAMRGSDNQRLHVLTEKGVELSRFDRAYEPADQSLDVIFDQDGNAWFAGIPARGDLRRLRKLLEQAGHRVMTSDLPARRQP